MPLRSMRSALCLVGLLVCFSAARPARADDGIFPAAPAAKKFIDFDGRGFFINGQRTFIASGSLHYSRVPRALWHDRLMRMKRAGFNTVQTYAFWNFHEPQEGKWDFSGDQDFNAFLQEIKAVGMYAVIRPGPYVCAEWDSGGYPVWLRFKPGVRVREDNPQFEAAVDRWYEKIMPIIAANQIQRGGPVIMVQLENEHPQGWGRDMPNGYFRHLRDTALRLGLEVPYFFSGLHHGSDPGGDKPWDSKGRSNPWYTTEFWPGWYNLYGPFNAGDLRKYDRGTWKIIAYGGNGYNYYMLHGGTDFDTWNDDEVASSYDYGGAIGQAGDLRPIYYCFKRAAMFAHSFQSVLEDSENATDDYKDAATSPDIHVTARRSPAGTILFLDNNGNTGVSTGVKIAGATYPSTGSLTIAPGEIVPIVTNYKLLPGVTLDFAASRILGISTQDNTTTIVFYGQPDSPGEARFSVPANLNSTVVGGQLGTPDAATGRRVLTFNLRFPTIGQELPFFINGTQRVRLLSVSDAVADHTWFVETGGQNYVICGPNYVGDVAEIGGHLRFTAERAAPRITVAETTAMQQLAPAGADPETPQDMLYTATGAVPLVTTPHVKADTAPAFYGTLLNTTAWQMRRGDAEAQAGYKDGAWKTSDAPLAMGADGDTSAYAWYRATVHAPHAGNYILSFSDVGDWITAFINGQAVGSTKIQQRFKNPVARRLPVALKAGDNTLAVLAAHYGRHKLFGYLGPIDTIDQKGMNGTVTLSPLTTTTETTTPTAPAINWRWKADDRGEAAAAELGALALDTTGADWHAATPPGEDVFHERKGFVWYRATLGAVPGPHRTVHFESVDDNATVYLNGQKLIHHEGWEEPFDAPLDAAWHDNGPNILTVLVENNAGPGGIRGAVELQSGATTTGEVIHGWHMRGGLGEVNPNGAWQRFNATVPAQGYGEQSAAPHVSAFYRTEFMMPTTPNTGVGLHLIQRITLDGLSRGFVWLNGHNLGRYPEKVPVKGLYLPECWLLPGRNSLVIFDEEGNSPTQAHVVAEQAASRLVVNLEPSAR